MIKIYERGELNKKDILARRSHKTDVSKTVSEIIENVRKNGDAALYKYTEELDGAVLSSLELTAYEEEKAFASLEPEFIEVMKKAADNIRRFHEKQQREGFLAGGQNGEALGQLVIPIEKAGLYVPGGTAAYPSTVLMDSIPAKIAGVGELVMVSPCGKDGRLPAAVVAAAKIAGVDRIFKLGGAQAIAALAYGTESVPRVDKIVGPGNIYVSEAKRQVFGDVAIDMIAGPSEILIVSDKGSEPAFLAADLLSQAEHDKNASAVLVCTDRGLAEAVSEQIELQLEALERKEIAAASIENNGKIIIAEDILKAIDMANELAPEHLELSVDEPFELLGRVKNAGSVFLGRYTPEALGDYLAGPNHTLPTMGSARFSSPLSVDDFIKKIQFTYYTKEAFFLAADDAARFAIEEGLTGHARSVRIRKEQRP